MPIGVFIFLLSWTLVQGNINSASHVTCYDIRSKHLSSFTAVTSIIKCLVSAYKVRAYVFIYVRKQETITRRKESKRRASGGELIAKVGIQGTSVRFPVFSFPSFALCRHNLNLKSLFRWPLIVSEKVVNFQ